MERFESRVRAVATEYIDGLLRKLRALPIDRLLAAVKRIEQALGGMLERVAPTPRRPARPSGPVPKKAAPKRRVPARRKTAPTPRPGVARRIRGQYGAYLRRFSERERDGIRKIAEDKGQAAAVAEMKKRLAKKK